MLPTVPPNSRRSVGTMNATLRMCSRSGRMWYLNRSGNTMMVAHARGERDLVGLAGDFEQLRILELEQCFVASPRERATRGLARRFEPRPQHGIALHKRATLTVDDFHREHDEQHGRAEPPRAR